MVKSVGFENFLSFSDRQLIDDFSAINTMIGPNGAGKSNIIKGLIWYRNMCLESLGIGMFQGVRLSHIASFQFSHKSSPTTPVGMEVAYELNESERKPLLQMLDIDATIRKAIEQSELLKKVRHAILFDSNGFPTLDEVSISNVSGSWFPLFGITAKDNRITCWVGRLETASIKTFSDISSVDRGDVSTSDKAQRAFAWTILKNYSERFPIGSKILSLITDFVEKWISVSPIRELSSHLERQEDRDIKPTGENVLRVISNLQGEDSEGTSENLKKIYELIPYLRKLTFPMKEKDVTSLVKEEGVDVSIQDTGSGLHQLIVIMALLFNRPGNSLFLIEEPESHVHASSQRMIFKAFKLIAADTESQFIITSHSTIFASTVGPACTYLVTKKGANTAVRKLTENYELSSIKHALGHNNTDLFGFNGVIIIEGETEQEVFPRLANRISLDFSELGLMIINLGGSGRSTRLDALVNFLKYSDTQIFAILDKHSTTVKAVDELIRQNIVHKNNIYFIEGGIEDCFDDGILTDALNSLAREKFEENNIHDQSHIASIIDIQSARNENNAIVNGMKRIFHEKTGGELSKRDLGIHIAEKYIATNPQEYNIPEKYLLEIATSIQT